MASVLDILSGHPSTGFQTQPTYSSLNANLANQLLAGSNQANAANQQRLNQILAIYDEVVNRYQPGGAFEKAGLQELATRKKIDVGKEYQGLISSGLFGTTTKTGVPSRWEAEVGAPSRLRLEDVMMQRLSQAQIGKAGVLERVEDVGPDYSMIANLLSQAGGGQTYSQSINYPSKSSEPNLLDIPLPKQTAPTGPIKGTGQLPGGSGEALYDPMKARPLPTLSNNSGSTGADTSIEAYRQYASGLVTGKQLEPGQGPIGYAAWKKLVAST